MKDANVVHYIAGYVCRKVRKNIQESSHLNKDKLLRYLEGLLGDGEESSASATWVHLVDRGGLVYVKEETYMHAFLCNGTRST